MTETKATSQPHFSPCEITLAFGDGAYLFRLPLKQIAELERLTEAGIGAVWARILTGRIPLPKMAGTAGLPTHGAYKHADLHATIRLGLIGGGQTPTRANELMDTYVHGVMPLKDQWDLAASILMACVEGYKAPPDEVAPKDDDPDPRPAAVNGD